MKKYCSVLTLIGVFCLFITGCSQKAIDYKQAVDLYSVEDYEAAERLFAEIVDYKDTGDYLNKINDYYFEKAIDYSDAKTVDDVLSIYREGVQHFSGNIETRNGVEYLEKLKGELYDYAIVQIKAHRINAAIQLFTELEEFEDSDSYIAFLTLNEVEELAVKTIDALYDAMKDPDSLKILDIAASYSEGVNAVCIRYSGKNGFGGTVSAYVMSTSGKLASAFGRGNFLKDSSASYMNTLKSSRDYYQIDMEKIIYHTELNMG